MTPDPDASVTPEPFPWAPLAAAALALLLLAAGPLGWHAALAAKLDLSRPLLSLLLAGLPGLPLLLYALALERGRPAPALRAWPAPLLLSALCYSAVAPSGSPSKSVLRFSCPSFSVRGCEFRV